MADKIRVNYAALDDMAKHCDMVSERLQALGATGNQIGQQMVNGALVGQPGDVFVGALNTFNQRVTKLANKFTELANDIRAAESDMRQADQSAAGKF